MRSPVVVLSILTVLAAPPIRADSPQISQRFHATARWGTFEEMDSPALLRKDGEPGNLVLDWAGSQQAGAALGFEILPGLTLDVGGAEVPVAQIRLRKPSPSTSWTLLTITKASGSIALTTSTRVPTSLRLTTV